MTNLAVKSWEIRAGSSIARSPRSPWSLGAFARSPVGSCKTTHLPWHPWPPWPPRKGGAINSNEVFRQEAGSMSFTSCSSRLGGAMFVLALEAKGGNMGIPWPCWKRQPLFSAPPTPTASNLTKSVSTRRYFVNIAYLFWLHLGFE